MALYNLAQTAAKTTTPTPIPTPPQGKPPYGSGGAIASGTSITSFNTFSISFSPLIC